MLKYVTVTGLIVTCSYYQVQSVYRTSVCLLCRFIFARLFKNTQMVSGHIISLILYSHKFQTSVMAMGDILIMSYSRILGRLLVLEYLLSHGHLQGKLCYTIATAFSCSPSKSGKSYQQPDKKKGPKRPGSLTFLISNVS